MNVNSYIYVIYIPQPIYHKCVEGSYGDDDRVAASIIGHYIPYALYVVYNIIL